MSAVIDTTETPWLRPSALPKLAQCGFYRPEANAGEAAARGTKLDVIFRDNIVLGTLTHGTGDPTSEERNAVAWAVQTARVLAGGLPLEAREEFLRVEALGLSGTADLLCEDGKWSADLKTGQVRDYYAQQALYALGFMDLTFSDEWTVYLLFCDQEEVVTHRYTREEAWKYLFGLLARIKNAEVPHANDYCGWCARRWECTARKEQLGILPLGGEKGVEMQSLTSIQLRDFCLRAKVVEEFADKAREILLERILGGEQIPGVSRTSKQGTKQVPENVVELHWKALGTADILAAYGPMSEKKFREIWARKMGDKPFPESDVIQRHGSTFVTIRNPKA